MMDRSCHLDAEQRSKLSAMLLARVLIQFFPSRWNLRNHRKVNDTSTHPRPRENTVMATTIHPPAYPSFAISILAHFPSTLSRFHLFHPRFLSPTCQEIKVPRPASAEYSGSGSFVNAKVRVSRITQVSYRNCLIIIAIRQYRASYPDDFHKEIAPCSFYMSRLGFFIDIIR